MTGILGLHVISASDSRGGPGHLEVARAACAGGATVFQLRVKERPTEDLLPLARAVVAQCLAADLRCIVNDHPQVAVAAGAHGFHVGLHDADLEAAVALAARHDLIMGFSATCLEEALLGEAAGAHYLGVGPVFATGSKADAAAPLGLEGLREIRARVRIPLVAIGGITRKEIPAVIAAGAQGVAVISAVTHEEDMTTAVRDLRARVERALAERGVPDRTTTQESLEVGAPSGNKGGDR